MLSSQTNQSCLFFFPLQDYRFTLPSRDCQRHFPNVVKLLKVQYASFVTIHWTINTGRSFWSVFGCFLAAQIVMDRVSDRSKGFGFVTFASDDDARKALMEFNGQVYCLWCFSLCLTIGNKTFCFQQLNGRVIFVDYAKAKQTFGGGGGGLPIARGPPRPGEAAATTSNIE